jgi:glycosyltransferase involved in cell wall biosynthesis
MPNNSPAVSVIVPVYNTQKYLRRCLDSILAQTFTDWECLVIDDGSTDTSPAICDEYAAADTRFRAIHQVNKGVVAARAAGIKQAKGNYIYFIDSDDYVQADCLSSIISYTGEGPDSDIDIVVFEGFTNGKINRDEFAEQLFQFRYWGVWGKLYKRCLFDEYVISVPRYFKVGEDFLTLLRLLKNISQPILICKESKYVYNSSNSNSASITVAKSYEYERAMVIETVETASKLNLSEMAERFLYQWELYYMGGMIALQYDIDYSEKWVQDIIGQSQRFSLSTREKFILSAVKNPAKRYLLIIERKCKDYIRHLLKMIQITLAHRTNQ